MSDYRAPEETLVTAAHRPDNRPKVTLRRGVSNLPIRVPSTDWAAVVTGKKGMFRTYNGTGDTRERPVVPPETECPRPCLLFTTQRAGDSRRTLAAPAVLLSHRQEPLGSITPEDLAREGHHFLPAFRYYWKQRYRTLGWRPWEMISVLEVRPLAEEEVAEADWGPWLFDQLYGEWLPE